MQVLVIGGLLDLRNDREGLLFISASEYHSCPFGSKLSGCFLADSSRGSSDDRNLAPQVCPVDFRCRALLF